MNSFHVGNSLTGNASGFRNFIHTAGGRDDFPASLIGGALTWKLWNESHGADKARWEETWAKVLPIGPTLSMEQANTSKRLRLLWKDQHALRSIP